jgi:hypothetical protein
MLENVIIAVEQRDWKSQTTGWISVPHLINQIANWSFRSKEVEIDLINVNIEWYDFKSSINMFDFLVHYQQVQNADLSYPVILNNKWQIVDGRHRLAKAILEWHKTLKGIQIVEPIEWL